MQIWKRTLAATLAALVSVSCTKTEDNAPAVNSVRTGGVYATSTGTKCEYLESPPVSSAYVQISGDSASLPCRLQLRKVATLDDPSFDIDPALALVAANSRGEYVVVGRNNVLGLMDSSGKLIRKFGRAGSGPGEFRQIAHLVVAPFDTVYVFDNGPRRMTVIDPGLERLVRTVPTPALFGRLSLLALPQSQLLVGGQTSTGAIPDSSFNTLRLVSAQGEVVRAFSADTMLVLQDAQARKRGTQEPPGLRGLVMLRQLARGADNSVLVAHNNKYVIEQWNRDLNLMQTFERKVAWFPMLDAGAMRSNYVDDSTNTQIYDVGWDDANRNVIVKMMTAARSWKAPPDVKQTSEGSVSSTKLDASNIASFLETIVETFNPQTGTLTASARFPGMYGPVDGRQLHWARRELPSGDVVIDIVRVELVGKP